MKLVLGTAIFFLIYFVTPVPARRFCNPLGCNSWTCSNSQSCCSSFCGCCVSNVGAAYWYAWFLIALFFFVVLCACVGCGGYRYRRYYYVQRYPAPQTTTVISAGTSTTTATGYQHFTNDQYKPYQPPGPGPQAAPPTYAASTAPPPYTKGY